MGNRETVKSGGWVFGDDDPGDDVCEETHAGSEKSHYPCDPDQDGINVEIITDSGTNTPEDLVPL